MILIFFIFEVADKVYNYLQRLDNEVTIKNKKVH